MYSAVQSVSGGDVWASGSVRSGESLLVLGGESEALVMSWRGVYSTVQVREQHTHSLFLSVSLSLSLVRTHTHSHSHTHTHTQTLIVDQATAVTFFSPQADEQFLLLANGGSSGNRELTVDVYQFIGPESVSLVQQLPSQGVVDLATFSVGSEWYVLVVNGEDNTGDNIVDSTLWWWNGTSLVLSQVS